MDSLPNRNYFSFLHFPTAEGINGLVERTGRVLSSPSLQPLALFGLTLWVANMRKLNCFYKS